MNFKRHVVICATVLAFLFSFGVAAATAATPIKLGAVYPLGDITGNQGVKAMKLAVKEINDAGGLLGRPVELIVIDDEMKPEKGSAAIEKLATVDKVDVFVGGMASGVLLAQIPIMKKYQTVTVWTGAAYGGCEKALGADANWFFHLHPWDYQQGESYVEGWEAVTKKYPQVKTAKQRPYTEVIPWHLSLRRHSAISSPAEVPHF